MRRSPRGYFSLSTGPSGFAVVAVFQRGWLAGLLGVEQTGPIMSMMPIFMVGIVSSVSCADVFVRLCDVDPRGRSSNVCDGLTTLRAADQAVYHDPTHLSVMILPARQ